MGLPKKWKMAPKTKLKSKKIAAAQAVVTVIVAAVALVLMDKRDCKAQNNKMKVI